MKALVVNCSAPHYNLGARKLADWLESRGDSVVRSEGDPGLFGGEPTLVCLSVIFSKHAILAREIAMRFAGRAEVWCGGPGMFALAHWWKQETGGECSRGVDARFDGQRGDYRMTFASRGCPVNCSFCIVPRMEGVTFSLNWDFQPAPILCDNNLSALPDAFQDHIIATYAAAGVRIADCNSGFEPRTFTEETYERWKPAYRGDWRFAFDEMREETELRAMMAILRNEPARKKRVYVLVANETFAECYHRAESVLALGGEPHCQYVQPLNWLGDTARLNLKHGWTFEDARDFCRYYNTRGYRSYKLSEYKPRVNERPPFAQRLFSGASPTNEPEGAVE